MISVFCEFCFLFSLFPCIPEPSMFPGTKYMPMLAKGKKKNFLHNFYLWKRKLFYIQGCFTFGHTWYIFKSSSIHSKTGTSLRIIIWHILPKHSQFKIIRISAHWSSTSYERVKCKYYSFSDYPEHLTCLGKEVRCFVLTHDQQPWPSVFFSFFFFFGLSI